MSAGKKKLLALSCAAFVAFMAVPSRSGAFDLSLHGFIQGNYSVGTASENPDGGDLKWAEERVQLKLDASHDPFYLFIKTDASYDHPDERAEVELREGYLDFVSTSWDLRAGRQIITWGIGDLLFINDVYPKDYEAFYAGRPLEYLKTGVDALKVGIYSAAVNLEIVVIPAFEPTNLPRASRFHNSMNPAAKEPATTLGNTEVAVRAYRNFNGLDAALYYYRGFFRTPSMSSGGGFYYPKLTVYGASVEGRALHGVLGVEAGHYDSREDRGGDDPFVPNSRSKLLVSYKRQLMEDFTVGLQYFTEYMHEYSLYEDNLPPGAPKADRFYQLTALRLTRFLMHQSLRLSFFAFYSPSDGDYLLSPEIKYKFNDNLWAALGGNVFGGSSAGQFGRLNLNDNAYLQVRYEF